MDAPLDEGMLMQEEEGDEPQVQEEEGDEPQVQESPPAQPTLAIPVASPAASPTVPSPTNPSPMIPSPMAASQTQVVTEAMHKWKAENENKIKAREAENAKLKQDLMHKAQTALEKHQTQRRQKIEQQKKTNREAQAKEQAAASSQSSNGAVAWSKMSHLVDLEKETTDRERMRLLFKSKAGVKS